MRTIVWTELRRSVLALGVLALAVAQVALMLNDVAAWRGVWPMASAAIGAPWMFLGPAAAGLSALDALQRSRQRGAVLDGIGWRSTTTAMLLARLVMVCVVILAGIVCAAVVNAAAQAPSGFFWPSYLVMALSFALGSVAFGVALGCLGGPVWFAPVAAALATFVRAIWFQGLGEGSPGAAFTRIFIEGRPWDELNVRGVVGAVLEALVVVVLALVAPVLVTTLRARRVGRIYPWGPRAGAMAVAGAVTVLVGTALVVSSPPLVQSRAPAADPPCSDTHPVVCVWPENVRLLPALAAKADRADAIAQSVGGHLMPRIDEYGLSRGDNFLAMGQGTWFFTDSLGSAIARSLAPEWQCDPPADDPALEQYYTAQFALAALFQMQIEDSERPRGYGNSADVDIAEVNRIWQADEADRHAWIAARTATMKAAVQDACA
ncbi:hypothetical protein [Xylanimonas protaetiae]|uniref:Uncharacterized protein n=1 Tax=Xylanimonas protaetiae TaxID=2509457 RepID=A0A4P6FLA6_9MICO|nr:hypothetical protein [Xylanimonas protaetiae]QAY71418.1 hypothetical protein ET471_16415 [Xylanimonas protaetiae]